MQTVVVIGGGIAGVSAAAFLAASGSCAVTLVEQEATLAHHTTGRSAAQFVENLGAGPIRPLTAASRDFYYNPPEGFADAALLTPQPVLMVGEPGQNEVFEEILAEGQHMEIPTEEISVQQAAALFPLLRADAIERAFIEHSAFNIDVSATHQVFVRMLRHFGGSVAVSTRVDAATRDGGGWQIETTDSVLRADVLVNASGAWGDVVAQRAEIAPVGLRPLRRTAFMVKSPLAIESAEWPMLINVNHDWYVKPDGPQFLCSPADETPSEPCDAKPMEIDVAGAIEAINNATTLNIRSVTSQWAGLRTFSPDNSMVIGPEPGQTNFIWCVGQGGTGIQTSPAAGRLVADLVTSGRPSEQLTQWDDFDLMGLLPRRYR